MTISAKESEILTWSYPLPDYLRLIQRFRDEELQKEKNTAWRREIRRNYQITVGLMYGIGPSPPELHGDA